MTAAAGTVDLDIRMLFMMVIDHNDEKVASYKTNIPNSRLQYQNHTIYDQNDLTHALIWNLRLKRLRDHAFWGLTYLCNPN